MILMGVGMVSLYVGGKCGLEGTVMLAVVVGILAVYID